MSEFIKKADLELLLSGAAALQNRELAQAAIMEIQGIGELDDDIPLSAVYEMAEYSLRLPREFVERYYRTRFPTKDEKIETVNQIGGKPSWLSVAGTYSKDLIFELKRASPLERFHVVGTGHLTFSKVEETTIKRGLFKSPQIVTIPTMLAHMRHDLIERYREGDRWDNSLTILDPFFAEVCKEKLRELQVKFVDWKIDIRYDYPL